MNRPASIAAMAAIALFAGAAPSLAAGFTCPTPSLVGVPPEPRKIAELLPTGDAFDDVVRLNAAVAALRQANVPQAVIIDRLIAGYCTTVAQNTSLTDAQRTEQMRSFASRIIRTVYALDSADRIILDIALPPSVVTTINAKAAAAGVSPQNWVASEVEAAVKAGR
jgi:hypothetical protein